MQDTAEELDIPEAKIIDSSERVSEVVLDDVVDADVPAEARMKIKVLQSIFMLSCFSCDTTFLQETKQMSFLRSA